jgi:hypothetical protein
MGELTPETREKLGKLLRLLGSDKEGEVTAAVAAMDRVLEGAGLDFNTFADLMTDPTSPTALDYQDRTGLVFLSDGRIVQDPSGPVDPLTGRRKPPERTKGLARGDPWKNWCAQQRHENAQRELLARQEQRALTAPKEKPFVIDPLPLPARGVKA